MLRLLPARGEEHVALHYRTKINPSNLALAVDRSTPCLGWIDFRLPKVLAGEQGEHWSVGRL
ncbi:hypothetical protein [Nonomuraea cavernae]|nr:hypothetical protein [Nonomuraea cavernae]MCA2183743.1 hypothetical protein [Nonomuraea cavernae]